MQHLFVAEPVKHPSGAWWIVMGEHPVSGPYSSRRAAKRALKAIFRRKQ